MSHTALRRVVIRLLHDPELARALAADAAQALAGIDLTPDEVRALATVPAAAWRTDPDRPRRVLAALCEEFAAATALAPARTARFFSSPHFHRAVQERGSLAAALAAHLADDDDARVVELARLEGAIARARRAPRCERPGAPGTLRLSSAVDVLTVRDGATTLLQAMRAGTPPNELGRGSVDVLVVRQPSGEVTLEDVEPALAALLRDARSASSRDRLVARARTHGADPGEAEAAVDALVADGLLVRCDMLARSEPAS